jgi:hypothetical protein
MQIELNRTSFSCYGKKRAPIPFGALCGKAFSLPLLFGTTGTAFGFTLRAALGFARTAFSFALRAALGFARAAFGFARTAFGLTGAASCDLN